MTPVDALVVSPDSAPGVVGVTDSTSISNPTWSAVAELTGRESMLSLSRAWSLLRKSPVDCKTVSHFFTEKPTLISEKEMSVEMQTYCVWAWSWLASNQAQPLLIWWRRDFPVVTISTRVGPGSRLDHDALAMATPQRRHGDALTRHHGDAGG